VENPRTYDCNNSAECSNVDLTPSEIIERTSINERPGEEPLYVKATFCFKCDDKHAADLVKMGFVQVTKREALGEAPE